MAGECANTTDEEIEKSFLDAICQNEYVRPKFLNYTPSTILEINDCETLQWLYEQYKFPNGQWLNSSEEKYCEVMVKYIWSRLQDLVRPKFVNYTPSTILEINDCETLQWLYEQYKFPNGQWLNSSEEYYCEVMAMSIWSRLQDLQDKAK